jgi:hypothetical protein
MSEKDDHEMVYEQLSEESGLRKVAELIKHLRIAMLTTAARDVSIRRPMAMQMSLSTALPGFNALFFA